jgi:exodeoxyribonuclease V alpha subunit
MNTPQDIPPSSPSLGELLEPFQVAGILGRGDSLLATTLAGLAGETSPDVVLGTALALAAPRRGDVCAHLGQLPTPEGICWPSSRQAWKRQLEASPLVRLATADGEERPLVLEGDRLYLSRYFHYERRVAENLRRLSRLSEEEKLPAQEGAMGTVLDGIFGSNPGNRQRQAAIHCLKQNLTILTGGPGTGKTYTVRGMLVALFVQLCRASRLPQGPGKAPQWLRVALAAPTGKAAARLQESLQQDLDGFVEGHLAAALPEEVTPEMVGTFLRDLEAGTLHRLLRFQRRTPTRFYHNCRHPLDYDVVVVDESSMVDVALMAKLLDAIGPRTRLILLGDADQLVSVECGSVLADLCAPGSGLEAHVVRLTESRRFQAGSGIAEFVAAAVGPKADPGKATRILLGSSASKVDSSETSALAFLSLTEKGGFPKAAAHLITDGYRSYLEHLHRGPGEGDEAAFHREVLRRFDRFRILSAHRHGSLGVEGLNRLTRYLLEREGLVEMEGENWLGRPVLITENDYSAGRFNGDIGLIVARFDTTCARLEVAFPEGASQVRYLPLSRLPAHREAFALTIHKSQGSEYPHVLVVLPPHDSRIATRELLYTGVTRARERVTLVGQQEVLSRAMRRKVRRASGLRDKLCSDPPSG